MKKQIITGAGILIVAFTSAAFTTSQNLQANSYLQKPNNCQAIPLVDCSPQGTVPCYQDDDTGIYPVYQGRTNSSLCHTPLFHSK